MAASAGLKIDRLGHEQVLRLQRPGIDPRANLLVQNPLVQGMLIDNRHAFLRLGHQIAIVDLQGRGGRHGGRFADDRLRPIPRRRVARCSRMTISSAGSWRDGSATS